MKKSTLFSTPKERHAFATGIGDAICFWRHELWHAGLKGEEHYFAFGRTIGVLFYISIILIIVFKALGW